MKLFVDSNDTVEIELFMSQNKKGSLFCETSLEDLKEMLKEEYNEEEVETHSVIFKQPTYSEMNKINDSGVRLSETNMRISPHQIRYERVCVLLKSWSFKDESGNIVPATRESIKQLHPAIADTLGLELEMRLRDMNVL